MAEKHLFLYNFLGTINNQISRQLNLMFESCQPRSRCILNSDLISAFMLTREEERTFKGKYPERESSKLDSLLVKWMFIQFIKAIVSIEFIIMIFFISLGKWDFSPRGCSRSVFIFLFSTLPKTFSAAEYKLILSFRSSYTIVEGRSGKWKFVSNFDDTSGPIDSPPTPGQSPVTCALSHQDVERLNWMLKTAIHSNRGLPSPPPPTTTSAAAVSVDSTHNHLE